FPRPAPESYHSACLERLEDLADWFFRGESPYLPGHTWPALWERTGAGRPGRATAPDGGRVEAGSKGRGGDGAGHPTRARAPTEGRFKQAATAKEGTGPGTPPGRGTPRGQGSSRQQRRERGGAVFTVPPRAPDRRKPCPICRVQRAVGPGRRGPHTSTSAPLTCTRE